LTTISVCARQDARRYNIYIEPASLSSIGGKARELAASAQTALVVTDDTVKTLYLQPVMQSLTEAGLTALSFSVLPGEASKNAERYISLLNHLAESRLTRADMIIALGGGLVGDLAGFAAATYLRGIPFVQVPTTLLAMVDSSVGGKTGIDLPAGKNLAGAFYQPSMVLCDPDVLATLASQAFADGCAEVIKYGMIQSGALLKSLVDVPLHTQLAGVIETCVGLKRDIVQKDVLDTGERQLLNFGHTVGHAIEALSRYEVSHGRAVAIGMSVITRAAARKNLCPPECRTALERLLALYNLPDRTDYTPKALHEAALHDKKRAGGFITEPVPSRPGECVLRKMPVSELLEWIEAGFEP